jgi:serine beta-lactamase-like protein LACTB
MRIITAFLLLFYCYSVSAQTSGTNQFIRDQSFKKAIQTSKRYIDSLQSSQHIPGLSICVGNRDKILWAEGFGSADLENQVPVTINSMFRLGSVSKVLTSLGVGRLYQQGKLDLDASIQRYLPDFPEKRYSFTARQLAGHTAGIRHYGPNDPTSTPKRYKSVQEGLAIFSKDSLLFKPGSAYNYSTYGYNLLSAVVEAAAGKDFLSYMRDSIFLPLGLTHTSPDYNDSILPGRVRFYENIKNGKVVNAALVDNSYKWAGGGFLSTPVDLVNMIRGLLNHRLLDEKTVEQLFTSQHLDNGSLTNVGIAWRINETKSGVRYIHHGGLIDGGRTFVFFYPDSGYVFAITANTSSARLNIDEAATILDFFLTKK